MLCNHIIIKDAICNFQDNFSSINYNNIETHYIFEVLDLELFYLKTNLN